VTIGMLDPEYGAAHRCLRRTKRTEGIKRGADSGTTARP